MFKSLQFKIHGFSKNLKNYFDISAGADPDGTVEQMKTEIPLKGSNIWYLVCSTLLASIGLNMNSPAIIIGAMLISPFMSPILGIGISFGIHDKETLLFAIKNFVLAIIISLLVSTIYFLLTPLSGVTSEILARTKPTLLDVGVGTFGGIAGIVAISRTRTAQAIPGAAIATALMPPVCSAGFGLATGDSGIFLGAIYLFFINAVFISVAAYIVVRYLKFPYKEYLDKAKLSRMRLITGLILLLITVPSGFLFYDLISEVKHSRDIENFIDKKIRKETRKVIQWKSSMINGHEELIVYTVGDLINKNGKDSLNKHMNEYHLDNCELILIQIESTDASLSLLNDLRTNVLNSMELKIQQLDEKTKKSDSLEAVIKNVKLDSVLMKETGEEIKIIYPELNSIAFSRMQQKDLNDTTGNSQNTIPVIIQNWSKKTNRGFIYRNERKLYEYWKSKIKADTIIVINQR